MVRIVNNRLPAIEFAPSKPCHECSALVRERGLRRIYYTESVAGLRCESARTIENSHESWFVEETRQKTGSR